MATDVSPIGRISLQDADPATMAASAPTPASTAAPTLNPADSPYQPLELPKVETRPFDANPPQTPQNLGATNKAGAVAYLVDNILKGAARGVGQAQAHMADQYNKKLSAQQAIYNDQAKQLHDLAASGVDPNSPEFQDVRRRVLASWQSVMQTVGERIPQPKKSSKSKQGQPDGTDQTALLQAAMDHSKPQDALQATYQIASKIGPPVFHQIQPYLSPAYRAKQQQGAQTQATQAQTGATTADTQGQVADINNKLAHAVSSGAPQDQIDALVKQRDELSPSQKFPVSGLERTEQVDGKWFKYRIDESGREIPNTRQPISATQATTKPLKYDQATDSVVDPNSGKRYSATDKDLPADISSIFAGVKRSLANKSVTTTGTHTVMVQQGNKTVPVEVETSSTRSVGHSSAISHPEAGATGAPSTTPKPAHGPGVVSTGASVGWKPSPAYTDLSKKAADAQAAAKTIDEEYRTALKQSASVLKDPSNGPANVGLAASYLKNVIGGHNTGVRINQAEWNNTINSRPWLAGVKAQWGPDGYMTGVVLSPKQAVQMANEIKNKRDQSYATWHQLQSATDEQQKKDSAGVGTASEGSPHDDEIMNLLHPKS